MGQGSLAKLIKVRQLVKWERKFDDLLHWAGATTNNNLHRNRGVNGNRKYFQDWVESSEEKFGHNLEVNIALALDPIPMSNDKYYSWHSEY